MTITIKRVEDGSLVPFDEQGREAKTVTVRPGEPVRWVSPHGEVRINFRGGSPFGGPPEVPGSIEHRVTAAADQRFRYDCGVTIDGQTVGWPGPSGPGSGGEMEVVRPA